MFLLLHLIFQCMRASLRSELSSLSAFATRFAFAHSFAQHLFQFIYLDLVFFLLIIVWSQDHPSKARGDLFLLSIAID